MQLTLFSDISLRVLMYLASQTETPSSPVTVRSAASALNVPYTHMVKVVHQLGREGLLATARGGGGGIRLSRAAKDIRVGDVLRMTEGVKPVVDCGKPVCPLRGNCRLKTALDRAQAAFFAEMDQYTLAQLADGNSRDSLIRLPA